MRYFILNPMKQISHKLSLSFDFIVFILLVFFFLHFQTKEKSYSIVLFILTLTSSLMWETKSRRRERKADENNISEIKSQWIGESERNDLTLKMKTKVNLSEIEVHYVTGLTEIVMRLLYDYIWNDEEEKKFGK